MFRRQANIAPIQSKIARFGQSKRILEVVREDELSHEREAYPADEVAAGREAQREASVCSAAQRAVPCYTASPMQCGHIVLEHILVANSGQRMHTVISYPQ